MSHSEDFGGQDALELREVDIAIRTVSKMTLVVLKETQGSRFELTNLALTLLHLAEVVKEVT